MAKKNTENPVDKAKTTENKPDAKPKRPAWRRALSSKKEKDDDSSKLNKQTKQAKPAAKKETAPNECLPHYGNFPMEGLTYKTCLTDKYLHRAKYSPPEPGTIFSQIPGTIKNIAVKVDQHVSAGELLCILDAMKMNNEIVSPYDGTISEINVKSGQVIAKDVLLFKIALDTPENHDDVDDAYLQEEII